MTTIVPRPTLPVVRYHTEHRVVTKRRTLKLRIIRSPRFNASARFPRNDVHDKHRTHSTSGVSWDFARVVVCLG